MTPHPPPSAAPIEAEPPAAPKSADREPVLAFARLEDAFPEAETVVDLFEQRAREHPDRPALSCPGGTLSYGQLERRANQLANHLIRAGFRAGAPVALSVGRSLEMIVGMLGILKAGGAYVPLDPSFPPERLSFILNDSGASILVAETGLAREFPTAECQRVNLSADDPLIARASAERPPRQHDGESLAYIIYTSGSTGTPKGVPISHRNLACSTAARLRYYNQSVTNYLLLSSFAFDSSVAGIFWTLGQGGTLTLPREGAHLDPRHLIEWIASNGISHLLALPSLYSAILRSAHSTELQSLQTVIVAGESCSAQLVKEHFALLPRTRLYNEYGPTEGTVWSTVHRCDPAMDSASVPIGRPVPNVSIYILDAAGRPSPAGQIGEIHIGGPMLARGYWNRPELTAEKFIQNPFDPTGSSSLYKTGDLGAFRPDGTIEFHGRADQQLKIRGYRVEIGEVEAALAAHPAIKESAVVARHDPVGDKQLAAYFVPRDGHRISIADLRDFLGKTLPSFMLPAYFTAMRELPKTPTGKIDRNGLPSPEPPPRSETARVKRNGDEEALARIWSEVLKLESIGSDENFFEIGGHSLLAIQVIARIRGSLKVDLPMAAFFQAPTIRGLARELERARALKPAVEAPIRRRPRQTATDELVARFTHDPAT